MKVVNFGKHAGRPLSEVPVPYLLYILTRLGIRREHPNVADEFLNEVADRLVGDFDAALAELLAPVPPEEIAAAKLRKAERSREKLAKLDAQRQADHKAVERTRERLRASLAATPGGRAVLARRDGRDLT